ncbi:MAG: DUF2971 domain-containing protein [Alphaproteobacteria bacterium]|nr:DUF2971 domain-containing protein [Alphaproteobacteria bacterium]
MQTAQELGIRELYRYQQYKIEWLRQTIQDNRIFLSNPSDFNDPWDCKPYFYSNVDDPMIRKDVIDYYVQTHQKAYPDGGGINIETAIKKLNVNPEKLKALMNKTSEGIAEDINKQYRLYCLTTKPSCPLMWGHYAGKHTGVCLEFKVPNEVFCGALKVDYEENYPPFELTDNSTDTNVKAMTTKSKDWEYEDEYRLIALEKSTKLPKYEMLITDRNFLSIPDGALNAIILGCMMPEENKRAIKKIIDTSNKDILIKQTVRLPNKYGLDIEIIN